MAANISDAEREEILKVVSECGGNKTQAAEKLGHARHTVIRACQSVGEGLPPATAINSKLLNLLKRPDGATEAELLKLTGLDAPDLGGWIDDLVAEGRNLQRFGDRWHLVRDPQAACTAGQVTEYVSRPDGSYVFGAMGDTHLGSKYERLDALHDYYAMLVDEGADRVYHAGNWIEGEARFNKYEISVHGMDAQCRYLAEHYPEYPGLTTYAIAGDDHEGWYAQRDGTDIGRYAENAFRSAGRWDWVNLGYMEACVRLVHYQSGASTILTVCHPGGGSAYAISYTVQKLVESYGGGEKPAVALYGHYHKLEFVNVRNVWCVQTGCFMDQSSFMRKKRLEAHVGAHVLKVQQDPATGAIIRAACDTRRYFVQSYTNNRWSHSGPVTHPELGRTA